MELIGFVGNTPELRYGAAHVPIVRFSLATHRWHDGGEGLVESTDWHQLLAFEHAAEACRRLRRGELVHVTGRLHTRSWVDRRHLRHSATEIIVDQVRVPRPTARQQGLPLAVPA
jgi:single stranded DNA-binding protein